MACSKPAGILVALLALPLILSGCGAAEDFSTVAGSSGQPVVEPSPPLAPSLTPSPTPLGPDAALLQDAEILATETGISVEDAIKRFQPPPEGVGQLGAALEANEAETFAGAFAEHDPDFRFVVLFTRDGEETIRRYVEEGSELAGIVEVREAQYTLAELKDAQAEASRLLAEMGNGAASSGVNVFENQVEIYVYNQEQAQQMLAEAGIVLPESVALIDNGGAPVSYEAPEPVPGVYFPVNKPGLGPEVHMAALLPGTLVLSGECLLVKSDNSEHTTLPIWPYDHRLRVEGNTIEVLNGNGEVVARVGEPVEMGGGEVPVDVDWINSHLHYPIPAACQGPYWIVGGTTPLGAGPGS